MTALPSVSGLDAQKRRAALAAVAEVAPGMRVGLGSGSTAAMAIAALSERVRAGLAITAFASSLASEAAARAAGIAIHDFAECDRLDLVIDGVDEIDPMLRAIKGAGGALLREKILASAADRMIAIADARKPVERLGAAALPVEILPFAAAFVTRRLREIGGDPELRRHGAKAYRTDQANAIIDCQFGLIDDPERLAAMLSAIPGVVGHGLFLSEIDELIVGDEHGVRHISRGSPEICSGPEPNV
jgi:ribose 5-phosphate isomerase A